MTIAQEELTVVNPVEIMPVLALALMIVDTAGGGPALIALLILWIGR